MFVSLKDKKLINILIDTGKVKAEVGHHWENLPNVEVEKKLKTEHMVSSEDITRAYAVLYSLPFVRLADRQIPQNVLEAIPENLAREYKIIAFERGAENTLKVAVGQPGNLSSNLDHILEDLENRKGFKIELAITTTEDLDHALEQYNAKQAKPVLIPVQPAQNPPAGDKTIDLEKTEIPFEVIAKFPEDIARKYKMVVFEAPHPSFIKVAAADPEDKKVQEILDFVKEKNDIAIEVWKTTPGQIQRAMRFYASPKEPAPASPAGKPKEEKPEPPQDLSPKRFVPKPAGQSPLGGAPPPLPRQIHGPIPVAKEEEVPEVLGKKEEQVVPGENDLDKFLGQEVKEVEDLQAIAEEGNVPKIVAAAIALAVKKKASDIHVEPGEKHLRLRFRIDGILRDIINLPLDFQPAIISRIKILAKLKIDESRIPQDGRFDVSTHGHQIDLRISTLPTVKGEKAAMRILDKSAQIYTLEELGLTGRNLKVLTENIDKPYGIVLATGPTGSGKSTTLYAILNRISTASVNIITLEDPVEYEIPGLNQCQIKPKIGFTFANGLRSVLRQDPNIIMVGEIRDAETASLATHAALTGHLVLSSLHTNDAPGALPRLINMGVEPFLITSSINAILAQRLVRKLCPKCKKSAHIPEPVQKEIDEELEYFNFPKPYQFFEGRGCEECEQGYQGRIGIFEVLPMTDKIESLAISRRPASEILEAAIKEGMVTMKQDGLIKALKGITTVNEVLRVVTI